MCIVWACETNHSVSLQVNFLSVEAEELPDVSRQYKIEAVPTFLFFKNKQVIGRMNGANVPELRNLVSSMILALCIFICMMEQ